MDPIIESLLQFGVLGIWTAWLLWTNHNMTKRSEEQRKEGHDIREKVQKDIIERLTEMEHKLSALNGINTKLDTALTSINGGLADMREKYAEDRAKHNRYTADTIKNIKDLLKQ
jgi:hypothetical protein